MNSVEQAVSACTIQLIYTVTAGVTFFMAKISSLSLRNDYVIQKVVWQLQV